MSRAPDPAAVRIDGPWTHRDVYANGIRLHTAEAGDGPLVVLLHGFAGFWWTWRHQLTALGDAGFRAVAVDLRGYGDSDKPPRGYDAWTLSGDVAGLIKALGAPRAHLVGHGWGGLLAWSAAALHPRLVDSVTAVAAPHPIALRDEARRTALRRRSRNQARALSPMLRSQLPFAPERWLVREDTILRLFGSWSGPRWRDSPDFTDAVARYREAMLIPGVAHCALEYYRWAVRSQFRSEGRRYAEAMRRRIRTPVLQLYGADDPCVLPYTRTASDPWLKGPAEHHELPGVGNIPPEEDPSATSTAITAFLKAH
ncbi:alpha/beta fold hydrolase [Actinokineospora sp. NPDC004072]